MTILPARTLAPCCPFQLCMAAEQCSVPNMGLQVWFITSKQTEPALPQQLVSQPSASNNL